MDAVAELPVPVLMDWRDYYEMKTSGGDPYVSPENALGLLRKQFPGK